MVILWMETALLLLAVVFLRAQSVFQLQYQPASRLDRRERSRLLCVGCIPADVYLVDDR
jgi:hypothetical protein